MMDVSAALVVTSNEASKRMEVDYVEFNVDLTTGYSLSEQFIHLSITPKYNKPKYNIRLFTNCFEIRGLNPCLSRLNFVAFFLLIS